MKYFFWPVVFLTEGEPKHVRCHIEPPAREYDYNKEQEQKEFLFLHYRQ